MQRQRILVQKAQADAEQLMKESETQFVRRSEPFSLYCTDYM
jgi:hypothetical protein